MAAVDRPLYARALTLLQAAHDACFRDERRDVLGMSTGPFAGVNEVLGIISRLEHRYARPQSIDAAPRDGTEIWLVSIHEQEVDWRIVSINNGYWSDAQRCWIIGPPDHYSGVGHEAATHWLPKSAIDVDGLRGRPAIDRLALPANG